MRNLPSAKVRIFRSSLVFIFTFFLFFGALALLNHPLFAQVAGGSLEGTITRVISQLVRILNVLIVGFVVWAGFLIAKGEHSGMNRLIQGIVGLIVVNTAYIIINFFA